MSQAAARTAVDQVIVPWKKQGLDRGAPIVKSKGARFWDATGKEYIDLTSQFVFTNFGHGEPRVVDAVRRQAQELPVMASGFPTEPQLEAAALVADVAPGDLGSVFFSTSGAEANEAAIKMARDITGRPLICSRYRSYHGSTFGAMTLSRDARSWPFEPGIPGVIYAPPCDPYHCRHAPPGGRHADCGEHCALELEEVLVNSGAHRVAAVIVEPIVGANGVIVPGDGYLQTLREICDRHGILLIADEVMTGFGRTGRWFATEHWGVVPDIMALAKGLTGGVVPLAATVVRTPLGEAWNERPFLHGHTYSNHALGCAAAAAAIKVYREDDLVRRSAELGEYALERAHELKEKHVSVGDVRGKGLFVGLELVGDRMTKEPLVTPSRPGPTPKEKVLTRALADGVYIMPGQGTVLFIAPPLNIPREDLDQALDVLDGALELADAEVAT